MCQRLVNQKSWRHEPGSARGLQSAQLPVKLLGKRLQPCEIGFGIGTVVDPMVAVESLDGHLAQAGTILDCPFVGPNSIGVACYTAITNRFTAEQAHNLPPAQKALEDAFRANMGDRRHMTESPDGLKIKR